MFAEARISIRISCIVYFGKKKFIIIIISKLFYRMKYFVAVETVLNFGAKRNIHLRNIHLIVQITLESTLNRCRNISCVPSPYMIWKTVWSGDRIMFHIATLWRHNLFYLPSLIETINFYEFRQNFVDPFWGVSPHIMKSHKILPIATKFLKLGSQTVLNYAYRK